MREGLLSKLNCDQEPLELDFEEEVHDEDRKSVDACAG